jgi:tRNA(fMet)-specific endonuclease VapC
MRLALDTNAYALFMRGDEHAVAAVQQAERIAMPVPVLAELRYGFLNGTRGRQNEAHLTRFLDSERVTVLPCDEVTSHRFAELKLQLKQQGTPIPLNDIWIAALVLQHRCTLFTLDSDFDHLPQVAKLSR